MRRHGRLQQWADKRRRNIGAGFDPVEPDKQGLAAGAGDKTCPLGRRKARALSRSLTALVFVTASRKIAPKPIDGFALDNVLVAKQPYIGWVDGRLRQQHVEAKRHQIASDAKRTPIAA